MENGSWFPRMCGCCWQGLRRWSDETWRPRGSWRTCQANWMHLALFKFKGMQENFSSQVVIETFFFLRKLPMSVTNIRGIRLESLRWRMTGRSTQKCCVGSALAELQALDYHGLSDYHRLSPYPKGKACGLWFDLLCEPLPSHGEWLPSRWPIPQREEVSSPLGYKGLTGYALGLYGDGFAMLLVRVRYLFLLQGYPCILEKTIQLWKLDGSLAADIEGHEHPWCIKGGIVRAHTYGPVEEHGRSCRRTNKRERERERCIHNIYLQYMI